jgi:hypothetical protein
MIKLHVGVSWLTVAAMVKKHAATKVYHAVNITRVRRNGHSDVA